jgi:hypothetical protein
MNGAVIEQCSALEYGENARLHILTDVMSIQATLAA